MTSVSASVTDGIEEQARRAFTERYGAVDLGPLCIVIPAFRDQVSKYGSDRVALPYGGSALVLVLNRAAFDRAENRDAAKAAGLALEPPKTWTELDAGPVALRAEPDRERDHGDALLTCEIGRDVGGRVGHDPYGHRNAS